MEPPIGSFLKTILIGGGPVNAAVRRLKSTDLSPEQIRFIDAIRKPRHHHREIQLQKRFAEIPQAERFDTLLYFFTHSNNYGDQQDCSRFLTDVKSDCDRSLEELLDLIAPTWNLSVEELPGFLVNVYGIQNVVDACDSLAQKHPEESYERRSLATIAWWLKGRRNRSE